MTNETSAYNISEYGGSVNSDVSYFRGSGELVVFDVISGVTCYKCGSGEVWQPMQTMDLPTVLSCLKCGQTSPSERYNYTETEQ